MSTTKLKKKKDLFISWGMGVFLSRRRGLTIGGERFFCRSRAAGRMLFSEKKSPGLSLHTRVVWDLSRPWWRYREEELFVSLRANFCFVRSFLGPPGGVPRWTSPQGGSPLCGGPPPGEFPGFFSFWGGSPPGFFFWGFFCGPPYRGVFHRSVSQKEGFFFVLGPQRGFGL